MKHLREYNTFDNNNDFENLINILKHEVFEEMDIYACETSDTFTRSENVTYYFSAPFGIKNRLVIDNIKKDYTDILIHKIDFIKENSINIIGRQIVYALFNSHRFDRIVIFFEDEK